MYALPHEPSLLPDPTAFGWCRSNAAALARLAALAYAAPDEVIGALDFARVTILDAGGTEGFVAVGEHDVVLAFRGTEPDEVEDWIADLKFRKVRGGLGAPVHRGFLEAWERVRLQVLRALPEDDGRRRRIWVTGHSLGGAIAHLAACDLETLAGRRVHRLITFGEPRVGGLRHAWRAGHRLAGRYDRVVNTGDAVTVVPSRLMGFAHAAPATYIDEDGRVVRGPGAVFRLVSMVISRLRSPLRFAHAIAEYQTRLSMPARIEIASEIEIGDRRNERPEQRDHDTQ